MFEGIVDGTTLAVIMLRMHDIGTKLKEGESLIQEEEKELEHHIFGIEGGRFRDEAHRHKLIAQWWRGARLLAKRFKEDKEKAKK